MTDQPLANDPLTGCADQMKDGKTFCHGSHQAIECTEFTHAVGGADNASPSSASVTISRIGRIQFIGRRNPLQPWMHLHRIVDGKGIVAGNTEDMANAEIGESIKGVGHDRWRHPAFVAVHSLSLTVAIPKGN